MRRYLIFPLGKSGIALRQRKELTFKIQERRKLPDHDGLLEYKKRSLQAPFLVQLMTKLTPA